MKINTIPKKPARYNRAGFCFKNKCLTFDEKNKIRPAIAGGAIIYRIVVNFEEVGREESFEQAFMVFYKTIKDKNPDGINLQALDTCWIENETTKFLPIGFYDACEMAREIDLLSEDGRLVPAARH